LDFHHPLNILITQNFAAPPYREVAGMRYCGAIVK